jgi:hypothetical protein
MRAIQWGRRTLFDGFLMRWLGLFIAFLASSHCKAFQGEEQVSSVSVLVIVLPGDAAHQSHVSFDQVSSMM